MKEKNKLFNWHESNFLDITEKKTFKFCVIWWHLLILSLRHRIRYFINLQSKHVSLRDVSMGRNTMTVVSYSVVISYLTYTTFYCKRYLERYLLLQNRNPSSKVFSRKKNGVTYSLTGCLTEISLVVQIWALLYQCRMCGYRKGWGMETHPCMIGVLIWQCRVCGPRRDWEWRSDPVHYVYSPDGVRCVGLGRGCVTRWKITWRLPLKDGLYSDNSELENYWSQWSCS